MNILKSLKDFFDFERHQTEELARNTLKTMYMKHVGTHVTIERFDEILNEGINKLKVTNPKLGEALEKEWNIIKARAIKLNWDDLKDKYK